MMDSLAEETELVKEGFYLNDLFKIAVLLWVDDVISMTENKEDQL